MAKNARRLTSLIIAWTVCIVGASGSSATELPTRQLSFAISQPQPNPRPVSLKLVRDRVDRDKILALLRAAAIALPFPGTLPRFDPQRGLGACKLETDSVHARRAADFRKIGPKPSTTCPRRVNAILHRTTLRYEVGKEWIPVLPIYADHEVNSKFHISMGIEHPCTNSKPTRWKSETTSIVIDGTDYYKGSITSKPLRIPCGP